MQLRFLGGAGSLTGTKVLVECNGRRLLVDCGLFQGLKQLRLHNWSPLPVPAGSIDAVVLTHAHINHSGFLPRLVEMGFKGPVYATQATADLCRLLLPDAGKLQMEEAEFANLQGYSKHSPALPLYTECAAQRALEHLRVQDFEVSFEPMLGCTCHLSRAGHVLGAASMHLRCGGHSLLFSGDLGSQDDLLMPGPAPPEDADYVLLNSTYGNSRHRSAEALTRLTKAVNRACTRGGVVVAAVHAAGSAQLLLHALRRLKAEARIPDVPVYLNSPAATETSRLYQMHGSEHGLSAQACASLLDGVQVARDDDTTAPNCLEGPAVLVAAEGMAHGGRLAHHLKSYATDARNAIVFTAKQAAGSRGAAMLAGAPQVKIHGDWIDVRADVVALPGLSGHADRKGLLDWIGALPRAPRHVYLMHGEPEAADSLRQAITERQGWPCSVPEYLELLYL